MLTRRTHLKVKIKSLAAESKIIRLEERRALKCEKPDQALYRSLRAHRRGTRETPGIVRTVARHAQLAYGFIRGLSYSRLEQNTKTAPNWDDVRKQVKQFGLQRKSGERLSEFEERKAAEMAAFDAWIPK